MKQSCSKIVGSEEFLLIRRWTKLGPFGNQFRFGHRPPEAAATDPIRLFAKFEIDIRRVQTRARKDIGQWGSSPKKAGPMNSS